MKAIYDFLTIQVEMTNACVHTCSNCTRFCGHHRKPFFMDWDTFKRAVDSLKDWPRQIGIMGGEPTLHPEFERFVEYACEIHPEPYHIGGGKKPIKSLSRYIQDVNDVRSNFVNKYRGVALWTSVCASYVKHYEFIQESFIFQCINDHTASSRHQAWLMTRKEFGISDSDWVKIRDNCWWQQLLNSPSITPKGAFFCEVAAAMDMLFNGPGGWKIEKDWWKRGPEDFKDQLFWCEYCSGAFTDLERDANEEIDDVSPAMFKKLQEIGSPKVNQGKVIVHSIDKDTDVIVRPRQEMLMYLDDFSLRVTEKNKFITPQNVSYFIMENTNRETFVFKPIAFTESGDIETDSHSVSDAVLGKFLLEWIEKLKGWICIFESLNEVSIKKVHSIIEKTTFNPGVLHYFKNFSCWFFNTNAKYFKKIGKDGAAQILDINELATAWDSDKYFSLDKEFYNIINPDIDEWEQSITTNGLMRFYQLDDKFASVAFRSITVPMIERAVEGKNFYKITEELSKIKSKYMLSHLMSSKVKTAIHNALCQYLRNHSIDEIKKSLSNRSKLNFCEYYAMSMLCVGEEKQQYLLKCIGDAQNIYGLGITSYLNELKLASSDDVSVIDDIIGKADKSIVILGNRYAGKSVHMMLDNYGNKPVAICDVERHGYIFNGTMTYSPRDIVSDFVASRLIMCLNGTEAKIMSESLMVQSKNIKYSTLSRVTMTEMLGCTYLSVPFIKKFNEFKFYNKQGDNNLKEFLIKTVEE